MEAKAPSFPEDTATTTDTNTPTPTDSEIHEALRPDVKTFNIPILGEMYVRQLGFYAKTEFIEVLAGVVQDFFTDGVSLQEIMDQLDFSPENIEALKSGFASDSDKGDKQAELMIRLVVKFALRIPRLLDDIFLIALQVIPEHKGRVLKVLHSEHFTDEHAFGILGAFIDMNGAAFSDFFDGWKTLIEKVINTRQS